LQVLVTAGIDVSAKELVVAASREGQLLERLTFTNDRKGHKAIIRHLGGKRKTLIRVCLEATGVYSLDVALALHRAGVEVMIANPRVIRDYGRALLQRSKTDALDADVLLDYVGRMPFVPWTPPPAERFELRAITRRIRSLKDMLVQEKNRLHATTFTGELSAVVREDIEATIEHLEERIAALSVSASAVIDGHVDLRQMYELLLTVSGIGAVTALELLGELGMLPPDMSARQLTAHAGLDPRSYESGSSVRKPARISKTGNKHFRALLFLPAMTAVRYDPSVRCFFDRLTGNGKKPIAAYVAVMRKLLHAIHGVLSTRTPFDSARFTRPSA
jgi:transposase